MFTHKDVHHSIVYNRKGKKNPNPQKPPNFRNRAEWLSQPQSVHRSQQVYEDQIVVWENGIYLLSESNRICRMIHSFICSLSK